MKIIGWHIPEQPGQIHDMIARVKDLGFDSYEVTTNLPEKETPLKESCVRFGLKTFKVIEPLKKRPGAVMQVLEESEEALPRSFEDAPDYQGGEAPLPGQREILHAKLACPQDPGVIEYARSQVKQAKSFGHDGVCWDFIGYRNYRSCRCALCSAALKRTATGDINKQAMEDAFFEQNIVSLYDSLYEATKTMTPAMRIICHCYPVFLPNPLYGLRINVDYCGITVSWFLKPHWPIEKVETLVNKTVHGPYTHAHVAGMPMIGFYGTGDLQQHYRTPERIAQELDLLKAHGAQALMMCETGNILGCPEVAETIGKSSLWPKLI
ncbi:MAG: hypothetical protein A2268_11280 [Candidatus Raymondbacteria bacterium RifOxyA12_full_50_37]|uniref:Sugar phosphate isomerase/epimerase n=1 Tax=Candidatus Raymondbacteria bacterium RIFOXYD12_FULL_49_13 TaxID=1817890 RepID=A0A1F7FAE2_UNCRA|nr:MAG: hypothetical protein A2268_11280 [Candidatus Raymondbacteria bacterium RifOxyA12_full_50_37]OGJ92355.1 MAG: hypothetical protein A2248_10405 [Candidatus Raymondbacteria bacterium RIFOXYA2_FULL_49_16]OGJ94981.1 MAG: hypothetical protein A2487_05285 [Candidatus Raymondbacteria bacterium RifOxyC12_full_50_8]OGJ99336.1 MAG: hypothetical protein A2453_13465 [Candidatus Raymondbacteria bacterium RIFOXYC2_FULL_50_21]OGK03649.1 MAG: hypothetical protein A2519_02660 [Candidatus Raymondbacteria b